MIALGAIVILAGLVVLVVEAHISTGGVLGVAAVMAVAAGAGLIIAGSGAALLVAVPVSVVLAVGGLAVVAAVARKVLTARAEAVRTGPSSLLGTPATVRAWSGSEGQVAVDGTLWRARMGPGYENDPPPVPGEVLIVEHLDGLTLSLHRRQSWEVGPSWPPSSLSW